jgi:hypothetical protein
MKLNALTKHRNAFALYVITEEGEGIFTATLKHYAGSVHNLPPVQITLTRGIRHWIGSAEYTMLTGDLGAAIDDFLAAGQRTLENKINNLTDD